MVKKIDIGAYSAYAIAVKHGYKGTEEEWIVEHERARVEAAISAGEARDFADAASSAAGVAESMKDAAVQAGEIAVSAKEVAVQSASAANASAQSAEESKNAAETAQSGASTSERNAKSSETAASKSATDASTFKDDALKAKQGAETAQRLAEEAKTGADSAKTAAEEARDGAVTAKDNAETAKTAALGAKSAAETAKSEAETAKTSAETAESNAKTYAEQAATAKSSAETAAQSAGQSATNADSFAKKAQGLVDSLPSDFTAMQTEVSKLKDDLSQHDCEIYGIDAVNPVVWEQGSIQNYIDSASATRIRTPHLAYHTDGSVTITPESGYKYYWYIYDKNDQTRAKSSNAWVTDKVSISLTENMTMRIVGARSDDSTITPNDGEHIKISSDFSRSLNTNELKDLRKNCDEYSPTIGNLLLDGTPQTSTTRVVTDFFEVEPNTIIGLLNDINNVQFYVHLYDSEGTRIGGSTEWHTYKTFTVPTKCRVRIVMRYNNEPTITDTTLHTLAQSVYVRNDYDLYRIIELDKTITEMAHTPEAYFTEEVKNTINSTISTIDEKCLVFAVLTDSHADTDIRINRMKQTADNIRSVSKEVPLDGVIHMGDILTGTQSGMPKATAISYLKQNTDILKDIGLPLYMVAGNHDDNSEGNTAKAENLISDTDRYAIFGRICDKDVHRNGITGDFYKDFDSIGIRCIWLYGVYTDYTWTGFNQAQIDWLASVMESSPTSYRFVVFSHFPTRAENNNSNGAVVRSAGIENAISPYASRMIAFIHGHTHGDKIATSLPYPEISIASNFAVQATTTLPNGATAPSRASRTVTQDCWDVVVIKESGKLNFIRFGAGDDRAWTPQV